MMGWHDGHLHELETVGERYGIPDPEFDRGDPLRSEWRIQFKMALGGRESVCGRSAPGEAESL